MLSKLNVEKPYVLAGHSIAGFYTLSYAARYPKEVSAVIGIDPTVPAAKADALPNRHWHGINWVRLLATTGLVRAGIALVSESCAAQQRCIHGGRAGVAYAA